MTVASLECVKGCGRLPRQQKHIFRGDIRPDVRSKLHTGKDRAKKHHASMINEPFSQTSKPDFLRCGDVPGHGPTCHTAHTFKGVDASLLSGEDREHVVAAIGAQRFPGAQLVTTRSDGDRCDAHGNGGTTQTTQRNVGAASAQVLPDGNPASMAPIRKTGVTREHRFQVKVGDVHFDAVDSPSGPIHLGIVAAGRRAAPRQAFFLAIAKMAAID